MGFGGGRVIRGAVASGAANSFELPTDRQAGRGPGSEPRGPTGGNVSHATLNGGSDERVPVSTAATTFWRNCERYHDLAERFERHVEVTCPDRLTGRSGYYSCGCSWCAQAVTYYEYTGPRL